jgi:hypothetical protein
MRLHELSSRTSYGIDVALLWQECDKTAMVAVVDHHSGDAFVLEVHETDDALDMFHHPYAYAARRGVTRQEAFELAA